MMKLLPFATPLLVAQLASLHAQVIQTEPNDSIGTATASTLTAGSAGGVFSIGNNGDGPFGPTTGDGTGDFDFFSIPANAGQTIVFDVNSNINGTGVDTVIGIYNSSGSLVASNDDDGFSRDSFVNYVAAADDTYYGVVGNWVPSAGDDAGSLPTNPNTPGTGRGAPGGAVDEYEVVIMLDGSVYFSYDPPNFPVGGASETVTGDIRLTNEGLSTATITAFNLSGTGAGAFMISQPLPLEVAAGATATITVTFNPGGSDELQEASVEIVSDDIVHPSLSLPLRGKAIEGLLFRLPFDDPAGSPTGAFGVPAETSGNGFPAAMVVNAGAPAPIFGRPPLAGSQGFSTMFNDAGSSGNFVLTENVFPHTASFTYAVWVRPTAGSGEDTLFNRDPNFGQGDAIYGCSIDEAGAVSFRIAGAGIVTSEAGAVPDDSTHHIAVTHLDATGFGDSQADRTRLYIDGVMVDQNSNTFEVPEYFGGTNTRLWIGTRSAAGTGFNGDMDDFQLYNIELEALDISDLFENPGTVFGEVPRAPFAITSIIRAEDGRSVELTWNSRPGRSYSLDRSTDMKSWEEVNDSIDSGGLTTSSTASIGATDTHVYFRVREPN